jgi:hypothetical protein
MNIDPREWDLQERALREDAAYREVAQALRRSPGEPPADFAASVAALAAAHASTPAAAGADATGASVSTPIEGVLERWVLRGGALVLGLAFVYAIAHYDEAWREGFGAMVALLGGSTALNWIVAAGACMALSWAFTQGEPMFGRSRR